MQSFLELNRLLHIVVGFIGLIAFWIPLFARKGGSIHRVAGSVFRYSAMVVLSAAGLAVVLHSVMGLLGGARISEDPAGWSFLLFLGYLALVTGIALSHGIAVLGAKSDLGQLDGPYRRGSAWLAIGASVFMIGWALFWWPSNVIVLLALAPLGISTGFDILRILDRKRVEPGLWKLEHLGAMIGCGIAFHTAFAVFGANALTGYRLPGLWQVVPWVLPAAIGIPATHLITRHYRRAMQRRAQPQAA